MKNKKKFFFSFSSSLDYEEKIKKIKHSLPKSNLVQSSLDNQERTGQINHMNTIK